jgi:hypothetical protein
MVMTLTEYTRVRELIESRFRHDMAALERVWHAIHGTNPPDSPMALAEPAKDDVDETTLGQSRTEEVQAPARKQREDLSGLSAEERKKRKAEYARAWYRRNHPLKGKN